MMSKLHLQEMHRQDIQVSIGSYELNSVYDLIKVIPSIKEEWSILNIFTIAIAAFISRETVTGTTANSLACPIGSYKLSLQGKRMLR